MDSTVTEIARDTYRISTFHPGFGIQFNQFLIADDEPFLMHAGFRGIFPVLRKGMATVISDTVTYIEKASPGRV